MINIVNIDMGINMNMDIDEVKKRIDNRLITVRKHPFLDLFIYNYTHKTQYNGLWDQYTERCRGLIMDGNGCVLNNPFPKFFNLGQQLIIAVCFNNASGSHQCIMHKYRGIIIIRTVSFQF